MNRVKNILAHFFTPNENNNYRARLIRVDFLSYYLVFVLILTLSFKTVSGFTNVLGFATDISIDKLYQLTNTERTKNNLTPLTYNNELAQAAQAKAADMFAKNYWSHFGPNGESPWQFILGSGYRYEFAGENLAKNFLFSQGVVDAWMNSPTHRDNVLNSHYTDVGYAVVNGVLNGEETTLVVQMFGKPQAVAAAPEANTQQGSPLAQPVQAEEVKQPVVKEVNTQAVQSNDVKAVSHNLLPVSFNLQILFFVLIFVALGADLFVASRLSIVRLTGKNIVHMLFLGFVIAGMFLIARGKII